MSEDNKHKDNDNLIDLICTKTARFSRPVVYLEAGHFDPRYGADEFSINSLRKACSMLRVLISRCGTAARFVYGVLIDDLGLECGQDACMRDSSVASHQGNELPQVLRDIYAREKMIKSEKIILHSERNIKNRAINELRKLLRKSLPEQLKLDKGEASSILRFEDDLNESIELAEIMSAETWRVKCPSILAKHYKDVSSTIRARFPKADGLILVDWSEMLDRFKVEGGRIVFERLFYDSSFPCSVINTFWGDKLGAMEVLSHNEDYFTELKPIQNEEPYAAA